jgi:hypothetical protein
MVQECRMRYRSLMSKKASLLLALVVFASWVAPAVSVAATDLPEDVVHKFLNRTIGRSTAYKVVPPECTPGGDCLIKIRVSAPSKRQALAVLLTDQMKSCDPAPTSPCKSYGDTSGVFIQVVDQNDVPEVARPIPGTDPDPNKAKDAQIANLRIMVNSAFLKNPGWSGAFPQFTTPVNSNREVGLYLLFQRSFIQLDINDMNTFKGLDSFLPRELFNFFLKTSVPTEDGGEIKIFTDTQ